MGLFDSYNGGTFSGTSTQFQAQAIGLDILSGGTASISNAAANAAANVANNVINTVVGGLTSGVGNFIKNVLNPPSYEYGPAKVWDYHLFLMNSKLYAKNKEYSLRMFESMKAAGLLTDPLTLEFMRDFGQRTWVSLTETEIINWLTSKGQMANTNQFIKIQGQGASTLPAVGTTPNKNLQDAKAFIASLPPATAAQIATMNAEQVQAAKALVAKDPTITFEGAAAAALSGVLTAVGLYVAGGQTVADSAGTAATAVTNSWLKKNWWIIPAVVAVVYWLWKYFLPSLASNKKKSFRRSR